jgi:ABC-type nitrate/sulfonate/bicarbonate transport system substrate-binding protein
MKKIYRNLLLVMVLIGTMFVSVTACRTSSNRVIRIAQTGVYVSATAQIMKEKGFLEQYLPEDVTVEWSQIATGPDIREAIIAKKIDLADFSLMTYIAAYENNLPLSIISFSGSTPINVYSNNHAITGVEDFTADSKIAITNKSTNLHIAFLAYCEENYGYAMKFDNCLSPIPAADAIASLQTAADYDGAIFSFPMMIKAEENDKLNLIADMSDIVNDYSIGDVFVTHSDYMDKNPDIIEAFSKAQDATLDYISENPEECAEILSSLYGVEKEEVKEVLEKMPPKKEVVGYDKQAELLYKTGILNKEPTKFENIPNYENIPK